MDDAPAVLIEPSSGLYSPPLVIKLTCPQLRANENIYVALQRSAVASALSGVKSSLAAPPATRYTGPLTVTESGRVKVTAFIRSLTPDGTVVDSARPSVALYIVDDTAPRETPRDSAVLSLKGNAAHVATAARPASAVPEGKALLPPEFVAASNQRHLRFAFKPPCIERFRPFTCSVVLLDGAGYPAVVRIREPRLAIAIDSELGMSTNIVTVPLPPLTEEQWDRTRPVEWATSVNILGAQDGTMQRIGLNGGWDAFALSTPCIAVRAATCGATFTLASPCRCIFGLLDPKIDPTDHRSWREMAYSIHVSWEESDPLGGASYFRLYERGNIVEALGTESCSRADRFEIKLRAGGTVAYLVNDVVRHISRAERDTAGTTYALCVKLAAQRDSPALKKIALTTSEAATQYHVSDLLLRVSEKQGMPPTSNVCLRAWIVGADYVPASASLEFRYKATPRWAIGAFALATMFAFGSIGCPTPDMAASRATPAADWELLLLPRPVTRAAMDTPQDQQQFPDGGIASPSGGGNAGDASGLRHRHRLAFGHPSEPPVVAASPAAGKGYKRTTTELWNDDEDDAPPLASLREVLRSKGF